MLASVLTYALVALGSVGYDYGIRSASRSAIDNALYSSTERNAAIIYAAWALATSASVFAVGGYVYGSSGTGSTTGSTQSTGYGIGYALSPYFAGCFFCRFR